MGAKGDEDAVEVVLGLVLVTEDDVVDTIKVSPYCASVRARQTRGQMTEM